MSKSFPKSQSTWRVLVLVAGVGFTACAGTSHSPDGGVLPDAAMLDAGSVRADAGVGLDAGPHTDAGDVAPDASVCVGVTEGGRCTVEGASCGGPCTDACSFCNIYHCTSGTWQRMEIFPAPCFDCGTLRCNQLSQYCRIVSGGAAGSPDRYSCESAPASCGGSPSCDCIPSAGGVCMAEGAQVTVHLFAP